MAGDWIKMRIGLQYGDPHVVRIMSALNADKLRVIGALHGAWCLFDQYSSDGKLSYTPSEMDLLIGWQGFSKAMIEVGWLEFDGGNTLTMHNFDAHNGKSGKRRASETLRKQMVRNLSAPDADIMRTREEKRRGLDSLSFKDEPKVKSFMRPTLEEVRIEVARRGNKIDHEQFFNFYESKGWKVGNQSMKNWQAAIVTWEKRESGNKRKSSNAGILGVNGADLKRQAEERLKK